MSGKWHMGRDCQLWQVWLCQKKHVAASFLEWANVHSSLRNRAPLTWMQHATHIFIFCSDSLKQKIVPSIAICITTILHFDKFPNSNIYLRFELIDFIKWKVRFKNDLFSYASEYFEPLSWYFLWTREVSECSNIETEIRWHASLLT